MISLHNKKHSKPNRIGDRATLLGLKNLIVELIIKIHIYQKLGGSAQEKEETMISSNQVNVKIKKYG
jgi:hypothetical protein